MISYREQNGRKPNEIVVELTKDCNFNCEFCFNKNNNKVLQKENVFKIIEEISSEGIEAVRFTGGEPLLRNDLKEILAKAKEQNLFVILNTNASLINERNLSLFNYIDLALFSMHDINNLNMIKSKMQLLRDNNTEIMLATIAIKENIKNLQKFYEFVSGLTQNYFKEWFLLRPISNQNQYPIDKDDIEEIYKKVICYNNKYDLNIKISNSLPFCAINKPLYKICKGGGFDSGHNRIYIDSNGHYRTECFSSKIGDISEMGIMEVWNKKDLKDIREYKYLKKECQKCYFKEKCKGGLLKEEHLRNPKNVSNMCSVIIPTFNDQKRLSVLIKSLEKQTINNFEIIVVDDGSTDNTEEIVESLIKETPLKISYHYLNNTNVFGAGLARNYGAKKAKGEILIFLDQDCVAHPSLVENHLKLHEKHDIILGYYAGYGNDKYHYDFEKLKSRIEKNQKIPIISEFRKNIFQNPKEYENESWKYFVSANFSIKKAILVHNNFDERFKTWSAEDIELGYRLTKKNKKNIHFSKKCITFNTSEERMITTKKFESLIPTLVQFYEKYKTKELRDYCFERFYHTPLNIRGDGDLSYNKGELRFTPPNKYAFIRIDDVYKINQNLTNLLNFTIKKQIPINLQIIPGKVEKELVDYTNDLKKNHPELIHINQHGFRHENHNDKDSYKYEFGENRSYKKQKSDIKEGEEIMKNKFGENFSKIFSPPYYRYDDNTMELIKELNYDGISTKNKISEDKMNMNINPCINPNLDPIKRYEPLKFYDETSLANILNKIHRNNTHIGIVLHPHKLSEKEFEKFEKMINHIKKKGHFFTSMEYLNKMTNKASP